MKKFIISALFATLLGTSLSLKANFFIDWTGSNPKELATKILPAAYAFLWLRVLIHELGHAAAVKALTNSKVHINIGDSLTDITEPLIKTDNFTLHGLNPFSGETYYTAPENKKKRIFILTAGSIASVLASFISLVGLSAIHNYQDVNNSTNDGRIVQSLLHGLKNSLNPIKEFFAKRLDGTGPSTLTRNLAGLCLFNILEEFVYCLLPLTKGGDGTKLWKELGANQKHLETGRIIAIASAIIGNDKLGRAIQTA